MGVVARKSAAITNRDATPKVTNNACVAGGTVRDFVGVIEAVNGDSVGSTYVFGQIPSNARVVDLKLSCDDVGTTTTMDIGLYRTTADGGAVVDADFFASAVSLKDGAVNTSFVTHEAAGAFDIAYAEKMLWEALGLTSDPKVMYDVVGTLTGAADAGGTIALKGQYVV